MRHSPLGAPPYDVVERNLAHFHAADEEFGARLAAAVTTLLAKYRTSTIAVKAAADAVQIHGA
ncbi:hypothetical protein ACIQOV_31920, partial [Kitasatospora sp. NPDC091257]|uniref:hypothetical protein n=1 Tax=Kitasatospora sp. NPDC091257 TaxID=3364084 RepID=UPI00382949F8